MSKDLFRNPRRRFLERAAVTGGALLTGLPGILRAQQAPAVLASESARPAALHGLQIGDPLADRAIIWSRTNKEARMLVEWSTDERFANAVRIRGPHALAVSDYTARVDLTSLPDNADVFVRVRFDGLDSATARSEPVTGHFRTAPGKPRDIRFLWSGDSAGQGWGINLEFGGMKTYETMRQTKPDFFIHCGDTVYADSPMQEEVVLPDGSIWRNAFLDQVPAKRKVAETLDEFRASYVYNLWDTNIRQFNSEVPQIWQWDDHEVTNNWFDSAEPSLNRERRVQTLAARATRAFLEYAPLRWHTSDESERIYRHLPYGNDLDIFVIDMRSYRGPNSFNRQEAPGPETALLGRAQLDWLKAKLDQSRATWKVIASGMPLGLISGDSEDPQGRDRFENAANGDGPVLGREFEIAELLGFIKHKAIANVVWVTAEMHYCAAHYYDPTKAQFNDFEPFWEFVSGPLNAGTYSPAVLDDTFGPQVLFQAASPQADLPPSAGLQFFGQVDIDHRSKDMVVALKDLGGTTLFSQRLHAKPRKNRV